MSDISKAKEPVLDVIDRIKKNAKRIEEHFEERRKQEEERLSAMSIEELESERQRYLDTAENTYEEHLGELKHAWRLEQIIKEREGNDA